MDERDRAREKLARAVKVEMEHAPWIRSPSPRSWSVRG